MRKSIRLHKVISKDGSYHELSADFQLDKLQLIKFLKRHYLLGLKEATDIANDLLSTGKTTKLLNQKPFLQMEFPVYTKIDDQQYVLVKVLQDDSAVVEEFELVE